MIRLIMFAFANRNRAIATLSILAVLGLVIIVFPQLIAILIGNLLGAVIGGTLMGVAPFLGIILLFALLWGGLKKIGGLGK